MKRYIVAILILMGLSALVFSFSRFKPTTSVASPDATIANNAANPSTPTGSASSATAATPTSTTFTTAAMANITNHPAATATTVSTSLGTVSPRQRPWDYTFLDQFHNTPRPHPVRFELVAGEFAAGTITHTEFLDGHVIVLAGELTTPETGRFSFRKQTLPGKAGDYSGEVIFPTSQRAYRLEPLGAEGKTVLVERRLDEVLCLALPPPDPTSLTAADSEEIPPLRPDDAPNFVPPHNDGIISLQSLPGAVPVIYIDYRGGYTPTWGGITYEKPDVNNTVIKDVWNRVAEDFMPFNINVTTDIRVYEAAPENSRQRCVVTPTTTAAPGAGGVAYLQDWNNTGDRPCWSFYSSGKSAAEVISHEVGHTLALGHDGRTNPAEEYYEGQGSGAVGWAPIMGVGYSMPVVQWSKGEYANANQTQDDLYVITNNNNNVAYRADDTGATLATARYLEIYSNYTASAEGVIERTGDTDAFQFTTSGGAISLLANPVGDWANLAISATLANAAGTIMASNNPQTQLKASIALSIPAGTYTFRVTGAGRNNPVSNGFSDYASLGYYSITGNVAGAVLPARLVVAENSPNGFEVGTVPALNPDADPLAYVITAGNLGGAFALDDAGKLTVANSSALDYEALAATTQLPVQFELFVNITNLANPALTELNRRVVIQIQDVNEPPTISAPNVTIPSHTQPGTAIASINMNDPDAYSILTGAILAGNDDGVFTFDNSSRQIKVAGDLDTTIPSVYDLTLVVADNGIPTRSATNTLKITVLPNNTPFPPGSVSYAVYENIGGSTALSGLTSNPRFPLDPTFEKQLPSFEGDRDRGDAYGSVLRGYLFPPVSGSYTFWIASDDASELWMSGTTNPTTLTRIAYVNTYTSPRQWTQYSSQQSTARSLVAGQAYYIEARHKEGGGADHVAIAWRGPANDNQTNIIPGIYLAPRFMNYVPHLTGFTNSGVRRDLFADASVGQVTVHDVNATDTHTLTILNGNEEGIFHLDANGMVRVADVFALAATPSTNFLLTIRVTDSGSPSLSATSTVALAVVDADAIVATSLRREMFLDIGSGMTVGDLTNNAKFPGRPDQLETLPGNRFEAAQDVGENYGSRIRGYVIPPVTGNYRFFIASDDASILRFSMNTNPANAAVIASVGGWTDFENWAQYSTQTSPLQVGLVAGQRYYLEALHKEGGGGDHVSVAWLVPGSGVTNVIPATNLEPVNINLPPQINDQSFSVLATVTNGTRLGTINATDSPLDTLAFRLLESDAGDAFALDPVSGDLSVADNTLLAAASVGTAFHLVVSVQDSGYGGLYPLQTNSANVPIIVRGTNNAVWINPAGGSWSVGANWTNGVVADGADQTADFSQLNLLANATVTLDGSRTIGNLIFGDAVPSHNWTLNAGTDGTLTFTGSNSTLTVNNRGVTIGAELAGTNQLTKAGSGSLTLSNKFNHFSGDFNITGGTVFASIANDQTTTSVLGAKTGARIIQVGPGATLNFNLNNIFGGSGQNAANLPTLSIHGNLISTRFNVLPNLELNGGILRNANATDPANYDGFQFIGNITVTGAAPSTMDTVTGRGNHLNNGGTTFNVADVTGDAQTDFWARTILRNPSDDYGGNSIPATLLKTGAGTMTLMANNTYTGGTLVNEGALQVNGIIAAGGAVTVQSTATLSGSGIINAPVIINPGGHLAPGATIGLLTINNNLALNGDLVIEVNTASAPTNDWVSVAGTLTSATAGTVIVTNLGPALVAGQSFKLFNQPLVNGEAFAIQPPPGGNLIWTNRLAVDGTIAVTSLVATAPVNLSSTVNANQVTLTWPADHTGWRLQVQTNTLTQGLSDNWVDVPDSSTTNWFTFPIDPHAGTVFYRLVYP